MRRYVWAAAAATVVLAACGGGDGPGLNPTASVFESAQASVQGFIDYLRELVQTMPENLEPVSVSGITPSTSETAEPVPVR